MKHCTNCGFDINSNERICPHCGYQFSHLNTPTYNNTNIRSGFALYALVFSILFPIVGLILALIASKRGELKQSPNRGFIIASYIIFAIRIVLIIIYAIIVVVFGLYSSTHTNTTSSEDIRCKSAYTCTSEKNSDGKYVCIYKTGSNTRTIYCDNRYDLDKEN